MVVEEPERVRIACVTWDAAVLLLEWSDPVDGHLVVEPPGGGIEWGETPLAAAERELAEETGVRARLDPERAVSVRRDCWWAGRHLRHLEVVFYLPVDEPFATVLAAPTASEVATYRGHRWVAVGDLAGVDGLEPPGLAGLVERLVAGKP